MTKVKELYSRMIQAMNVPGLEIPLTAVKFYKNDANIPEQVMSYNTEEVTLTSCQAKKQASLGDAVLLTKDNIGCIAAAITFGLVDENDPTALAGSRVYTDIMKDQAHSEKFQAPSPKDFTDGIVYACKDSGHKEFCLFGNADSGRFKTKEIAKKAVSEMMAIQPAVMKGIFFYSIEFDDLDLTPDVVVFIARPVELTRIAQAYQFLTGERVIGNMGPVRVVNSDLIVRPFLTQQINFASYCVGARLIAQYPADRLGIGIPIKHFEMIVQGMEESSKGYPFELYPGANPDNT